MSGTLEGKTAIVTGSTRGIGRAMALLFAREGANVVVHGTNEARGRAVVDEIGAGAVLCLGDVAEEATAEHLASCAMERFGAIDIFVANAGQVSFDPFLEVSGEKIKRYLDVHVAGAFTTSRAAARRMAESGRGGRILYMSSVSGVNSMYGYAGYCAAKSAVLALARSAAVELAPHRITVNAIAPGPVENEMMEKLWGPEKLRERCRTIPAGRLATPEEIAQIALFLVSPAASYITGQTIFIDGGATAAGLYTHEVFKRSAG